MQNKIQAIVLAGGKGTRLAPLTDNLPKPLVQIRDKAIILYVLEHLKKFGITNIAISTAHLGEMVETALGDGSSLGLKLTYLREPEPMGTGGWTQLVNWDDLSDEVIVLNADNIFWLDLDAFLERHRQGKSLATIAAVSIPTAGVSGAELLVHDEVKYQLVDYIDRTLSMPYLESQDAVFISSGWYAMSPKIKDLIPEQNPISMEKDVWPLLVKSGQALGFYEALEPWFDSGTHERLERIAKFLDEHPELL